MFYNERSFKDFLLGLLLGGSLGTFLFKTEQGKKIQKELLNSYKKMSKKTHNLLHKEIEKRLPKIVVKKTKKKK